jgi:hypothetical protein
MRTISDVRGAIALSRGTLQRSIIMVFTNDEATKNLSAVGLPQLYFDQLCVMKAHIAQPVQSIVHKAIKGPKFICRSLHKQLDWTELRDS